MSTKHMTVIGFGIMGKEYARLFAQDFQVGVISSRDVSSEIQQVGAHHLHDFERAIAASAYVAITAPLESLAEIVERINGCVSPQTVVFDACSAKVPAMKILRRLTCRYFGAHILSKDTVAVFGEIAPEIATCFRKRDITVKHMTPEEHDRRNAVVGMAHFVALATDDTLTSDDKADLSESGAGRKLLSLIEHVTSNAPSTYRETQMDNPFMKANRVRLLDAFRRYHEELDRGEFIFHPSPRRRRS